nr:metal-dependent transcriptional regulator [bacterium]
MKIQESAENYLETIYLLGQEGKTVRAIDIAAQLHFSKPSVSYAMKRLRENGYITVEDGGIIRLTDKGGEIAERMAQRHRLLTDYLMALGVDADTARQDACRIEHVISQQTFDALRAHVDNRQNGGSR